MSTLFYINLIDTQVTGFLFSFHTPALISFFSLLTLLGNTWPVTVITALVSGWFLLSKNYRYASMIIITVSGAAITTSLLKILFARPRPDFIINQLDTFSFPSGHATSAVALYGILLYVLPTIHDNSRFNSLGSGFLILLIFLIGFSRIYLGYHYLSDVLIGYLVGFIWILVSVWLFKIKS